MASDAPKPKKLEDHEPGASRAEVIAALKRAVKPVKDKGARKPER